MQIAELAVQYQFRGVVAVDIAGDETLPMDQSFINAFQKAKKLGLHITVHAGESGSAANVKEVCVESYEDAILSHISILIAFQAIECLGAERIGHGYHVIDDISVYNLARERHVHFEV